VAGVRPGYAFDDLVAGGGVLTEDDLSATAAPATSGSDPPSRGDAGTGGSDRHQIISSRPSMRSRRMPALAGIHFIGGLDVRQTPAGDPTITTCLTCLTGLTGCGERRHRAGDATGVAYPVLRPVRGGDKLHRPCCDRVSGEGLPPPLESSAPHGARGSGLDGLTVCITDSGRGATSPHLWCPPSTP
jgi:hypothetical protein